MIVYLETSALLRWLLSGDSGEGVIRCLANADRVLTSRLTVGEARRVLARAVADQTLSTRDAARARTELESQLTGWDVMAVTDAVWARAEDRFPVEPVRMLDAIHLATALRFQELIGDVYLGLMDSRVLGNWRALGLPEALG